MTVLIAAWLGTWVVVGIIAIPIVRRLRALPKHTGERLEHPTVTAIVPARNEEDSLQEAMSSLVSQHYPQLNVIAVNDGSTDRTQEILDALAVDHPNLTVVHNPPLRDGWLGKPNAQQAGLARTESEWILLTDADIVYQPETITRVTEYCIENSLDVITLIPTLITDSIWEAAVLPLTPFGAIVLRPDGANTDSGKGFAAGAFTMVRREPLEAVGGFEAVKQEVIDDVALGRLLKNAGYRTAALTGFDAISVRMYHGLRSITMGLVKNISHVIGGNSGHPVLAPVVGMMLAVWTCLPLVVLVLTLASGAYTQAALAAAAYSLPLLMTPGLRQSARFRFHHLMAYPAGGWIVLAATVVASYYRISRGTVRWRDREVRITRQVNDE